MRGARVASQSGGKLPVPRGGWESCIDREMMNLPGASNPGRVLLSLM